MPSGQRHLLFHVRGRQERAGAARALGGRQPHARRVDRLRRVALHLHTDGGREAARDGGGARALDIQLTHDHVFFFLLSVHAHTRADLFLFDKRSKPLTVLAARRGIALDAAYRACRRRLHVREKLFQTGAPAPPRALAQALIRALLYLSLYCVTSMRTRTLPLAADRPVDSQVRVALRALRPRAALARR
eukprot:1489888-Prymnesium_polylepis.1